MTPDRFQSGCFRRSLATHRGEEFSEKGGVRASVSASRCVDGNRTLTPTPVIVHDGVLFENMEPGDEVPAVMFLRRQGV